MTRAARKTLIEMRDVLLERETLHEEPEAAIFRRYLDLIERELRGARPLRFMWVPGPFEPRGSCFEIYREGDEPHRYYSRLAGAWAVWRAIADRGIGASLCSVDLIPPHATTDKGLSRSIRRDAAAWFTRLGFPELAVACASTHIENGLITHEPAGNAPRILAGMGEPTWAPDRRPAKVPER
ncbi:MAG: hypothetical protein E6Q69_17035 [Aquipseudomonas alcaligenes]|uniref:Uncharacterized protein n=1 Tax=Aquipseudomonas alcaligenes TaxID=43263 RepID=A0A5C7VV79_AQUAC|nr:MAG: hypothetical protein E6Q69_17035 [Pseudomonas alcaligenes]